MPRVLLVTDSSTCIPVDLAVRHDIRVLPISVHLPEGDRLIDVDNDDATWRLPESVEQEELTGANHPFVTEYLAAVEEPGYEACVIVTPAIEFATMFRNAALAAELASRPTVAVDSRTAAAGQALLTLAGAEAAARGEDLETVTSVIEQASRRVELVASLATLEPIRKSGPIPAEVLGPRADTAARSLFRMRSGTVEALEDATSSEGALAAIEAAYSEARSREELRAAVFHADVPALAERLVELLGGVEFVSGFSLAMQVHTGRGVVGAAWLPRAPTP